MILSLLFCNNAAILHLKNNSKFTICNNATMQQFYILGVIPSLPFSNIATMQKF